MTKYDYIYIYRKHHLQFASVIIISDRLDIQNYIYYHE
jgi:hypothetical protein